VEIGKILLLLVDDDAVDRKLCERALSQLVMEIKEAENGSEALTLLDRDFFDCMILDYVLPDFDGLALVKEIRKRGYNVPIVVTTGHGDELLAVEMIKAGAQDYIPKDKVPELLARAIKSAIESQKLSLESDYYKNFYENSPIGLFTTTVEDGTFVKANPSFLKLFEAESTSDLLPASKIHVNPSLRSQIVEMVKKGVVRNLEAELYTIKGNRIWISLTAKLCKGAHIGKCQKCLANCPGNQCLEGYVVDINDKKMMALKIQKMKKQEIASLQEIQQSINQRLKDFDKAS